MSICTYRICPKISAKTLDCSVCGVPSHEICATKAKCFVQFGDSTNPENTIMCRPCQSKLLEVSMNASKILDTTTSHMNVQTVDTSIQQNPTVAEICSKMSELLDSKLTIFKESICNMIPGEISKIQTAVVKNSDDINSYRNDISLLKERLINVEQRGVGSLSTNPLSLLNATSTLANELKNIESRNNNLMVYGLTDSASNNIQQLFGHDFKLVTDLFNVIGLSHLTNFSLRRIGKYENSKTRALCVTLNSR